MEGMIFYWFCYTHLKDKDNGIKSTKLFRRISFACRIRMRKKKCV